ncbi:uncharacterized protein LOC129590527 [Paramacrobiotus metropolitanus]|uniref:uncharacterized protein LOC129590527 n=1 Tax=Paramacrobiotus metropolitanus TaxID=2943436 RepID=UPI002445F8C0|nr:uncharacterized protein LOC129590527 [Paramacrobiotus metropolitanus]
MAAKRPLHPHDNLYDFSRGPRKWRTSSCLAPIPVTQKNLPMKADRVWPCSRAKLAFSGRAFLLRNLSLLLCCALPAKSEPGVVVPRAAIIPDFYTGNVSDTDLNLPISMKGVGDVQQLYQIYRNLHSICKDCDPSRLQSWISSYYTPQLTASQSLSFIGQFAPGQLSLSNSKSPKAAWYLGRRKRQAGEHSDIYETDDESSELTVKRSTSTRYQSCLRRHSAGKEPPASVVRFCQLAQPTSSRLPVERFHLHPYLSIPPTGSHTLSTSPNKALVAVRLVRRGQNLEASQTGAARVRSRSASGPVSWYLGKRSGSAPAPVSWYLGKRSAPGPVSWYLGKRSGSAPAPVSWYLGKRSAPGPVSWYLGKRSLTPTSNNALLLVDLMPMSVSDALNEAESMLQSSWMNKRSATWYLGRRR